MIHMYFDLSIDLRVEDDIFLFDLSTNLWLATITLCLSKHQSSDWQWSYPAWSKQRPLGWRWSVYPWFKHRPLVKNDLILDLSIDLWVNENFILDLSVDLRIDDDPFPFDLSINFRVDEDLLPILFFTYFYCPSTDKIGSVSHPKFYPPFLSELSMSWLVGFIWVFSPGLSHFNSSESL